MERFSRTQWGVFAACFIAYTAAYLSRTNLAPALPAIAQDLSLTSAQTGMLATAFAVTYASGQLINGFLVDRFNVRIYILIGLLGSALMNFFFSQAKQYEQLLLIWLGNGLFQSMLWTPIVRILALRFHGAQRNRAVFGVSMTLVVGYLIAWAVSGWITSLYSWRSAFWVSAIATGGLSLLVFALLGNDSAYKRHRPADRPVAAQAPASVSMKDLLLRMGLLNILLCSMFNGFVRDGIMTWAPKMLMDTQGIDMDSTVGVMLIIPAVNLLGILLGRRVYGWMRHDGNRTVTIMMAACGCFALLLTLLNQVHPLICALLLGACSAVAFGLNPILTAIIPIHYRDTGRVAAVAGMIDASIYVGSAMAGALTGAVFDRFGWTPVFVLWIVFCALGVFVLRLTRTGLSAE